MPSWLPETLAERLPAIRRRARLAADTRKFLDSRGYTEVETPALVPVPGMEVHLHGFATDYVPHLGLGEARRLWLRTSPELACKRLLVAGAGPIFEFARVWRNGELGALHLPEFTLLEWYRPGLTMAGLMDETEALLRATCPPEVTHAEIPCDLSRPFARLRVADAFAGFDLLGTVRADGSGDLGALAAASGEPARDGERWEDLFFRLLLERVEPRLGHGTATFLTHWPAPQAALARRDPDDPRVALRFELYVAGVELANAFEELTDPAEQRARFAADVAERRRRYGVANAWPVDDDFLAALEHGMPPASGIALGFDRLAMLAAGVPTVADTLWLSPG